MKLLCYISKVYLAFHGKPCVKLTISGLCDGSGARVKRVVPLSEGLRPDLCYVGFLFVRLEAFSHFHSSAENKGLLILAGSSES